MYRQSSQSKIRQARKLFGLGIFIFVIHLLMASSCGGSGPNPAPDFSLSAASVTIQKLTSGAASGSSTITISRTGGFSGTVNLSITAPSPLPSGVTATLSETAPTDNDSTVNLTVETTAATGPVNFTVTGTGGGLTRTANFTLTINPPPAPTKITVSGKVIDPFMNIVASVPVKIGTATTTTGVDGTFTIPDVTTPYDVILTDMGMNRAYVFKGLTRSDPTLQLFDIGVTAPFSTTIAGNLSGGAGFPNPVNHDTLVAFGSDKGSGRTYPAGPAYGPFVVNWGGTADSTSGKLLSLQWENDPVTGLPTDYKGFASKSLTISTSGGSTSPATDLTLAPVSETSLVGNVGVAAGHAVLAKWLYGDWGVNTTSLIAQDLTANTDFSFTTPNRSDLTMTVASIAAGPDGAVGFNNTSWVYKTGLAPSATGVGFSNPAVPAQSFPVDVATGVTTSTSFSWIPYVGGVHVVYFDGPTEYFVVTSASSTTIPDLSAEGLPLPASAAYDWQVIGVAPFTSVDAATAPTGYNTDLFKTIFGLFGTGAGPENDGAFALSKIRTFTTAP